MDVKAVPAVSDVSEISPEFQAAAVMEALIFAFALMAANKLSRIASIFASDPVTVYDTSVPFTLTL